MRRNPLKNELEALAFARNKLEKDIKTSQSGLQSTLDDIYTHADEKYADGHIRSVIERLAQWASLLDAIRWLDEASDLLIKQKQDIDVLLEALLDRITWFYGGQTGSLYSYKTSPAIHYILQRYRDVQDAIGYNIEHTFEKARYIDHFIRSRDQFVYYYLHGTPAGLEHLYWILEDLLAAIRADDEFIYPRDGDLINLRHQRMAENITEKELADVRDDINSIITGRTYYGFRETYAIENIDSCKLVWSNGAARWFISGQFYQNNLKNILVRHRPAVSGFMDANIIIVPYPEPVVELILTSLYPLPLYSMSFEGKERMRVAGRTGQLVSDRQAKRLVTGLAVDSVNRWIKENFLPEKVYEADASKPMVQWRAIALWNQAQQFKAERDIKSFEDLLADYPQANVPGIYGQLINWFNSIEL